MQITVAKEQPVYVNAAPGILSTNKITAKGKEKWRLRKMVEAGLSRGDA